MNVCLLATVLYGKKLPRFASTYNGIKGNIKKHNETEGTKTGAPVGGGAPPPVLH